MHILHNKHRIIIITCIAVLFSLLGPLVLSGCSNMRADGDGISTGDVTDDKSSIENKSSSDIGAGVTVPSPSEAFYIYDEANVILDSTEQSIINTNKALFAMTGGQIVVVTVDTTNGITISDYTREIFNTWGIGSNERNNGVLLVLSVKDEDYWILQGEGISETLTDSRLSQLLNDKLEGYFAGGNFNDGIKVTFSELTGLYETIYGVSLSTWDGTTSQFTAKIHESKADSNDLSSSAPQPSIFKTVLNVTFSVIGVIIFIVVVTLLITMFSHPKKKVNYRTRRPATAGGAPSHKSKFNPTPVNSNQNSRASNKGTLTRNATQRAPRVSTAPFRSSNYNGRR